MAEPVDERLLPPQIRRMIAAIGLPLTLHLLELRGGTRLALPLADARRKHYELADLIGAAPSRAFYREFGGKGVRFIQLPKADKILRQARDAAIRQDCRTDSVSTVALRYRLTMRQVQNIKQSEDYPVWRKPDSQLDLFETL